MAACRAGASSTRGTYRSATYRIAADANGPPGQRPVPFAGASAGAGRAGRAGRHRRCPARCGQARPGAGPGGVRHRGRAAARRAGGAARQRRHPAWPPGRGAGRGAGAAGGASHRRLGPPGPGSWPAARAAGRFRPGPACRGYKNFITNFARGLTADPAAPGLSMRRPGPASSATTWLRAPRSRCCCLSPGSPRPGRSPATPAASAASAPPPAPCGPAGARSAPGERLRPRPASRLRQHQRPDGGLRRRADPRNRRIGIQAYGAVRSGAPGQRHGVRVRLRAGTP